MFDIGFTELAVIGLVALIVIGPEELPRVARTVGHLLGRLRRYVSDVKADISREMEISDLKRMHEEVEDSIRGMQNSLNEQKNELEAEFQRSIGSALPSESLSTQADFIPTTPALADDTPEIVERDENQLDLFGEPKDPSSKDRSEPA